MSYRCPKCHEPLQIKEHSYVCINAHTYDIAKGGYVNLGLMNRKLTGDDKGMVDARTTFLQHGYYAPLQKSLCDIMTVYQPDCLIDAGCGQGYYTNAIRSVLPESEIYGFDLSKFALKEACKARQNIHYAASSVADVPLDDHIADAWMSVFAPIYIDEVNRILKTKGIFIKVGPGPKHLYELKQRLYDDVYDNEEEQTIYEGFTLLDHQLVENHTHVQGNGDVQALFQMTPYYYRSPKIKAAQLCELDALKTRIQFHIDVYQKDN